MNPGSRIPAATSEGPTPPPGATHSLCPPAFEETQVPGAAAPPGPSRLDPDWGSVPPHSEEGEEGDG